MTKKIQEIYQRHNRPVRVLQFGEGNFLRAFVDYGIDVANEECGFDGNIAVVMPRAKSNPDFAAQNNLYTVCLRGQRNKETYQENRVITCLDSVLSSYDDYEAFIKLAELSTMEWVVSNTTEAGIVYQENDSWEDEPPQTYPAKLTKFLFMRFEHFAGATDKGLVMLPVELIDHNGQVLADCVKKYAIRWNLGDKFLLWLDEACQFVDTLVDRIVAGYPREEAQAYEQSLGYHDALIDQGEPFALWVIGNPELKKRLRIATDKFPVVFTDDVDSYKKQKVRILNGAHTSMVLGAYLSGFDYVGECMNDPAMRRQLEQSVYQEIVPALHRNDPSVLEFAAAVFERFANPFVNHALLSISLNSIAKWRARVLPSLMDYWGDKKRLPKWLTYSLAALLLFYHSQEKGNGCLIGNRKGQPYSIYDDIDKLSHIATWSVLPDEEYVKRFLQAKDFWGRDLTEIPGFYETVLHHFICLQEDGPRQYIKELGEVSL